MSEPRPDVTLLVNSSDGFEDCWAPFVHFLRHYWPACTYPVLLNTEAKDWSAPGVELRTSRVGTGAAARLSWSDCLIRAIDQVDTPLLLYFQEDYFIEKPVRDDVVSRAVQLMLDHPEIGHIALTRHGSFGPFASSPYPGFSVIDQNARYRISTQAALWRPDVLRSYLDPRENGWMFEILGTKRASKRDDLFLVADFDNAAGGPAIDYTHTGIIKGQWHEAMPALFAAHGLDVDFAKRGIYVEPPYWRRKWAVLRKLAEDPVHSIRHFF